MLHLITNLKKKSEREKTRYAFLFALSMTLLVGAVWTTSLPARFAQIGASDGAGNISDSAESAGFADLLESSKAQVGSLIEGVQESATTPELEDVDSYMPSNDAFDALTPAGYEDGGAASYDDVSENILDDTEQNTALGASSSTVTILAKPAPQTIMIATTTSQKSE